MERSASDGSRPERAQLEQSGCAWWWWVFALLIALTAVGVEVMNRKLHPKSGLFLWTDVDRLREIARSRDNCLGLYASVEITGLLQVGDTVYLE